MADRVAEQNEAGGASVLLPARPGARSRKGLLRTFLGWPRLWAERDRQPRELALMSAHDFGDIAVPPSLLRDEARRWPWQRPSAQWAELRTPLGGGPAAQP
jgi:uncharacterized protein YjiS (DUF1127 family)